MIEYHVTFSAEQDRWQVQWGGESMCYPGWDKRVATIAAKQLARQNRPSKVIVHDRGGIVQKEIPFEPKK